MPTRRAKADWHGTVQGGSGKVYFADVTKSYSFKARLDDADGGHGTNPEELIAAAQASCYSMALSARLSTQGYTPEQIETTAKVTLTMAGLGMKISRITINTHARVAGITQAQFEEHAREAKAICVVSSALAAVDVVLESAVLESDS